MVTICNIIRLAVNTVLYSSFYTIVHFHPQLL